MVGVTDCRSAGPWFNSGWKSLFTFLTGYDKLTNQIIQIFNNMSPIRTVITTITRKSVGNYSDNWHSIKNTKDLTMKHMFDISAKLVSEQDEIYGVKTI